MRVVHSSTRAYKNKLTPQKLIKAYRLLYNRREHVLYACVGLSKHRREVTNRTLTSKNEKHVRDGKSLVVISFNMFL